ncbi:hypothetical protein ACWCO9_23045 [Streptomyces sp. NPDC001937]
MRTYAIRNARTKMTGHYRQDGTRTTYCNKPVGATNGEFATLTGWKLCTRCVKAEQRDRAHAAEVAAQFTERIAPADREAAVEARYAAELTTEAEATAGTWRGEWIGTHTTSTAPALFALPAEQGALFA